MRRGHRVSAVAQDEDAVTLDVTGPDGDQQLRARYVVGADGARSVIRKFSGIGFPGVSYDRRTNRTAHATVPADWVDPVNGALTIPGHGPVLPFLPHRTDQGGFSYAPFPGQPPLVSTTEWDQPTTDEPMTLAEMESSIRRVLGVDLPLGPPDGTGPHVLRRLTGGNTRVADRFRDRRVFLVGDAAHVYASGGGPGLNLGLQDAANLGWKLAAALHDTAPPGLLDSYDTERRQAARRMVLNAEAQSALTAPGSDTTALRELFTELLTRKVVVQHLADLTAGTDVRYEMGITDPHHAVGYFAPELELITEAGKVRLAELSRNARPLLIDLSEDRSVAAVLAKDQDAVDLVIAQGAPAGLTGLLIRPDGYVAWACGSPRPDPAELAALRGGRRALVHGLEAIPKIKSLTGRPRHRPRRLFADRGYDVDKYRRLLWKRGIKPVIARRGVPHASGLGAVRWVVERTNAWIHGFRRLRIRWDIRDDIHAAFLGPACCVLTYRCVRALAQLS
ncbi:FAD-dependent monooxygenase [Streptomyces sp. NPDC050355]|uniref:FAD-dependent monooxygenase n=1 Tax=Streptomyces sp. NPDC050355 TaxID=3365609 RepID=UPI0037BD27D2